MERKRPAYAQLIRSARRQKDWSLDNLSARLSRPLSRQYLSDIERGARQPQEILDEIAAVLELPMDYFCFLLGRWPPDLRDVTASPEQVSAAFSTFRAVLARKQPKGDGDGN